jgi:hypothetical protein
VCRGRVGRVRGRLVDTECMHAGVVHGLVKDGIVKWHARLPAMSLLRCWRRLSQLQGGLRCMQVVQLSMGA